MRLLTHERDGEGRAGILLGNIAYDIANCRSFFGMEPVPSTLLELLTLERHQDLIDLEARLKVHGYLHHRKHSEHKPSRPRHPTPR